VPRAHSGSAGQRSTFSPRGNGKGLNEQAFRQYAERVLEDDFLTIDEEMAFDEVVASLDISDEDFLTKHGDLAERLILASRTRHTSGSSG
jgi:hypothetical protein